MSQADNYEIIVEELGNREQSYRLFSRLFLKPLTDEDIENLAAMELEKTVDVVEEDDLLARGFNDMGRGLHRRHSGTRRKLSTDFTMCFDGVSSVDGLVAVPYASFFAGSISGDRAIFVQDPRTNDLAAYRREHIQVDPEIHLPEDHLSFELSFMADLSAKAIAAYSAGDIAETARLLQVSSDFLQNNILCWYGSFFDRALKIIETRFYRGVLEATYGYLKLDQEALADLIEALA